MNRRRLLPIMLIGLILIAALAVLTWMVYSGALPLPIVSDTPPQVFILQPGEATGIESGRGVLVAAYAYSPAGINRVDLLVDGELESQYEPESAAPEVDAVFPWFGAGVGSHRLSVIAYDRRGQASAEAAVTVDVRAAAPLPDAVPASGAGPEAGDGAEPASNEDGVPAGDEPAAGDPADPVVPGPEDAGPVIDRFEVLANVAADSVTAAISGAASDDLGLAQLRLEWRDNAGAAGDFSLECGGAPTCEFETAVELGPGPWLFALRAVDTSGQSSFPAIESLEVVDGGDLPPAAADHFGLDDWLADHFGAFPGPLPLEPGFDLDDFMDGFFGDPAEPEAGEAVQADGQCLSIAVEPHADGNQVTITVQCELQVDGQDRILLPFVGKYLANTGDGGISLFIAEWYDNRRTSLSPGDSFTWLDWDVTCGTTYSYAGRVDEARVLDYSRNTFSSVGLGPNQAIATAEATTPACARGGIADVDLRAAAAPDGVQVSWEIAANGRWPEELPEAGVTFLLTRFEAGSEESLELYHENVPADLLLAGGDFNVLDETARCGNEYFYSLSGIAADADLGLVSPGWLLRVQVPGPDRPCAAADIGSLDLRATPYWFNESIVRVRLDLRVPAGFAWPEVEGAELRILRLRQGENQWQTKKAIPVTDQIRADGLVFEDDDTSVSFGDYVYVYRLALVAGGQELQGGPNVNVVMPPAPPPPPEIARLTATNDCPGGAPRCVIVEWLPYQQPRPGGYYSQATRIAVERIVGAIDSRLFYVELGDTRFVDNGPYMRVFELVDGTERRVCRHDVLYRMVAFDAEGHTFGASPLTVLTPDCEERWNVVEEAR